MLKLVVVAAVIAVVLGVYALRPHGASAAKVAGCLEQHGATARP